MTGIIATCGHQVDSVYDLTTVRLKDTTRDGKPAVSYCEYCPACAERIKGARAADTRSKLEAALAKPLPESHDMISGDDFDPWGDVIEGIHGHYAKGSDDLMIEALEAVRDGETFTFIDRKGFVGEFVLYVLSGHGLTEYGTSPRGGFPDPSIADLWQPLIDKWKAYKDIAWGAK